MKRVVVFVVMLAIVSLAAFGNVEAKSKSPIELSMQIMWPKALATAKYAYIPWINEVEKAANGKIKITLYDLSGLAPPSDTLDATRAGIIDICEIDPPRMAGRMSLWEVTTISNPYRKPNKPYSRVVWELYKNLPDEMNRGLEDLKVLFSWTVGPVFVNTVDKPIRTPKDFDGLKIWGVGTVGGMGYTLLGATPVALGQPEIFTSFEKGVVDGVGMAHLLAYDNNLWSIAKYITLVPFGMGNWPVVMNTGKWKSLPPDVQKAIESRSGDWAVDFFDNSFIKGVEAIKKENPQIEFIKFSDKDNAFLSEKMKPITTKYIEIVKGQGYSEATIRKVLNEELRLEAKYCR